MIFAFADERPGYTSPRKLNIRPTPWRMNMRSEISAGVS